MIAPKEDLFTKVSFTVIAALVASGVAGVWSMSTTLARLETRVDAYIQSSSARLDELKKTNDALHIELRSQDRRITAMEGKR